MIMFDGEDDVVTSADATLSTQLKKEGKVRRAQSRRRQGIINPSPKRPRMTSHSRESSFGSDRFEHGIGLASGRPHFPMDDFSQHSPLSTPYYQNDTPGSFGLTEQDQQDLNSIAELARPGHPQLDKILDQEIAKSVGTTMVAC
jgi:hypothetical protein